MALWCSRLQSGSNDAGEHHEDIISVMREVGVGGNVSALGEPFWLNRTIPSYLLLQGNTINCMCHYKAYDIDTLYAS